jgi:ABC-type molybdate transport system substrate-binding protein
LQCLKVDAAAFLNFVKSPAARPAFEKQGFAVLGPDGKPI